LAGSWRTPARRRRPDVLYRALPERCGVVAVPNSVFYDDPDAGSRQVRLTFFKRDDVLDEAASRLRRLAA
jgi:N-succinyldiaminopimelate aminotransferase